MNKKMNRSANKISFIKKFLLRFHGVGKQTHALFSNYIGTNKRIDSIVLKKRQIGLLSKKVNEITRQKTFREKTKQNILFLIENKTYKGVRHKSKLPVRGQRTHTNAKTKKKVS